MHIHSDSALTTDSNYIRYGEIPFAPEEKNDGSFSEKLIVSLCISLPDCHTLRIRPYDTSDAVLDVIKRNDCFLNVLNVHGKHAVLSNIHSRTQNDRIFTRIKGLEENSIYEIKCKISRKRLEIPASCEIYILKLQNDLDSILFKRPNSFFTRHTSKCQLTHLSTSAISWLGHLPCEVVNQPMLRLLHPSDVLHIKNIHVCLAKGSNRVLKIQRLRWITAKGEVVYTISEWYAQWNPWTLKIENVLGRHRIWQNLLCENNSGCIINPIKQLSDDAVEKIVAEIDYISSGKAFNSAEEIQTNRMASVIYPKRAGQEMRTAINLGAYLDNLVESLVVNVSTDRSKASSYTSRFPVARQESISFQETSEMPPLTYNQINCIENVHRLLSSQHASDKLSVDSGCAGLRNSRSELTIDFKRFEPRSEESLEEKRINMGERNQAIPLTNDTLKEHTEKWEQLYCDTWKQRMNLKRRSDFIVPVSAKIFRAEHRSSTTLSAPPRFDYTRQNRANRGDYYRRLGPNPPPPPGQNFQITTTPLPPLLPDEHRSAFVSVKPRSYFNKLNNVVDSLLQPFNSSSLNTTSTLEFLTPASMKNETIVHVESNSSEFLPNSITSDQLQWVHAEQTNLCRKSSSCAMQFIKGEQRSDSSESRSTVFAECTSCKLSSGIKRLENYSVQ